MAGFDVVGVIRVGGGNGEGGEWGSIGCGDGEAGVEVVIGGEIKIHTNGGLRFEGVAGGGDGKRGGGVGRNEE